MTPQARSPPRRAPQAQFWVRRASIIAKNAKETGDRGGDRTRGPRIKRTIEERPPLSTWCFFLGISEASPLIRPPVSTGSRPLVCQLVCQPDGVWTWLSRNRAGPNSPTSSTSTRVCLQASGRPSRREKFFLVQTSVVKKSMPGDRARIVSLLGRRTSGKGTEAVSELQTALNHKGSTWPTAIYRDSYLGVAVLDTAQSTHRPRIRLRM
jgi:hypothetical protein